MKKLLLFLLLAASIPAADKQFVPYDGTAKTVASGLIYTNGTFTGNGAGLTNLHSTSLTGAFQSMGTNGANTQPAILANGLVAGSLPAITITTNGNVGIGTTSPAGKLTVNGTMSVSNAIAVTGTAYPGGGPSLSIALGATNSSPVMTISTDGNVGIAVASPFTAFQVGPGFNCSTEVVPYRQSLTSSTLSNSIVAWTLAVNERGNNPRAAFFLNSSNNTYGFAQSASVVRPDFVVLGSAGAEKFRVMSTGNVGIGTTSPATKLDVKGISAAIEYLIRPGSISSASVISNGGWSIANASNALNFTWSDAAAANTTAMVVRSNATTFPGTVTASKLVLSATSGTNRMVDWSSNTNSWEDLQFPITLLNPPGAPSPGTYVWTNGPSGNKSALVLATGESLYYNAQMPHTWIPQSRLLNHIHLEPQSANSNSTVWRFSYEICDIGKTNAVETVVTNAVGIPANNRYVHRLLDVPTNGISMTGFNGPSTWVKVKVDLISATEPVHIVFTDIHYLLGGSPIPFNP